MSVRSSLSSAGLALSEPFLILGRLALLWARTFRASRRIPPRELLRCLALFGAHSLPLALGVAVLAGATVVLQTSLYVQRLGARSFLGWAAGYAAIVEFVPLLLGLVMAARIGARNAAELAALELGGQLEGLRGLALEPTELIIAPRVLAIQLSMLLLFLPCAFVAVTAEGVTALLALQLPMEVFFGSFARMLGSGLLLGGAAKIACYGLAISLLSTAAGLSARGGATGVGRAAASAVVRSSAAIFALDLVLTPWLGGLLR